MARAFSKLFSSQYAGVGTRPSGVTGLSAREEGFGAVKKTVIALAATPVVLADAAAVVAFGSRKIYDFPDGQIKIFSAVADLAVTKTSAGVIDAFDGDFSLGTVAAAGDATLTGTEANVIPSTPTPQAVAGATTAKGRNAADIAPFDGTGANPAVDLYLNMLVDDTDQDVTTTPANLLVTGKITILWANGGDIA